MGGGVTAVKFGFPGGTGTLSDAEVDRIVGHLKAGGVLGYPTETVYGLGGAARAEVGAKVRELKGREGEKPFLVLLPGDPFDPGRWGLSFPPEGERLADHFWPGPLTLVLPDPEGRFPEGVRSPEGGVAVRVSTHPFVKALLVRWGHPLISTSANRAGEAPARSADEVATFLAGAAGGADVWVIDGGELPPSEPSTVVDLTGARPRVVRPGAVSFESLKSVLSEVENGS